MTPEFRERRRQAHKRWVTEHRDEYLAKRRQRYAEGRIMRRSDRLKYNHGITEADYESMLAEQDGTCAICGGGPDRKTSPYLCIDHDHQTGRIRGLLCNACNLGVGIYETRREKMLAYLAATSSPPPP